MLFNHSYLRMIVSASAREISRTHAFFRDDARRFLSSNSGSTSRACWSRIWRWCATALETICPLQASSIGICIASLPSALLLGCVAMNSDLPFADERFDHFRQHKLSLHLFFPNAESWPLC